MSKSSRRHFSATVATGRQPAGERRILVMLDHKSSLCRKLTPTRACCQRLSKQGHMRHGHVGQGEGAPRKRKLKMHWFMPPVHAAGSRNFVCKLSQGEVNAKLGATNLRKHMDAYHSHKLAHNPASANALVVQCRKVEARESVASQHQRQHRVAHPTGTCVSFRKA